MRKHLSPINWIQWLTLSLVPAIAIPMIILFIQAGHSVSAVQQSRHDAAYAACVDVNARHEKTVTFVNGLLKKQGQPKTIVEAWDRFIQDLVPRRNCADYAQSIVTKK